ncbi:MAG: hypothetical protein AAF969_00835 [Bacteroidota bacterium]
MTDFEKRLTGGHPNSLGNTIEVVNDVLRHHKYFEELFNCYFSEDEVVRLRVSNAMKRIAREEKQLLLPYLNRFLTEIAQIDQASTQWTLAQLFLLLEDEMTQNQISKAKLILQNNLSNHQDWIVLNQTMETLGRWAQKDGTLAEWLEPHLARLSEDTRKSVSKKAMKTLQILEN